MNIAFGHTLTARNSEAKAKKLTLGSDDAARPDTLRTRLSRRLLAVRLQPGIDQRHRGIDGWMTEPLLLGNELHELVGAFDIGRAVVEGPCGGGRPRQALRRRGIFLEWHKIVR